MAKTMSTLTRNWSTGLNAEIAAIKLLHPDPVEALYRWVDNTIGIPQNSLGGGILAGIDALPVYIHGTTGKLYCTAIPFVRYMFAKMKFKELPVLCGMAKYDSLTGEFMEAILLESWPRHMRADLKKAIKEAYKYAKSLRGEDERRHP